MQIAVTSSGPTLDDQVEARFGRCPYFLIIDPDTLKFEAIENPNIALGGGAGIQSAQMMAEKGVSHVLTGNCGPNAFRTFDAAGVQVVTGVSGPVRQAVQQFKASAFQSASSANVESHFGIGGGAGIQSGQGMGGGRGMGKGMGMGRGGGMGKGMGRGMGQGVAAPTELPRQPAGNLPKEQELDQLKSQARALEEQLNSLRRSIDAADKDGRAAPALVASVDPEKCDACGICREVCPNSAIQVKNVALIDRDRCSGCGQCVVECPQNALSLIKA